MKRLLTLALFVAGIAHAGGLAPLGLAGPEGAHYLRQLVEESRGSAKSAGRVVFESADTRYESGDFVLLWSFGASDQEITQEEYTTMWQLMNQMARNRFRVVMDTRATIRAVREALETQGTSVVLFSGHGNETGFYDWQGRRAPYDILSRKAPSVYQFIIASCYSREALPLYRSPRDLKTFTWSGETNTDQMFALLLGGRWTGFEGKELGRRD